MNNNTCISCLISLVVNIIILNYVLNLEKDKCSCSKDWKRETVKYTSGILIVLSVVTILLTFINTKPNSIYAIVFFFVYMIVGLIHLAITCVYYIDLNHTESCNCSDNWKRHALLYPILLLAVGLFIGIINIIILWPEISKKLEQKRLNNKKKSNKLNKA